MAKQLEFYFAYASPYSYLANSQIPGIAERTGAEVIYRPVLLGAVVVESKNQPPPSVPAKARYMSADIPRWVARYQIPFAFNPNFPLNSVRLLRGALAALEEGGFEPYHEAMFGAVWAEGADLSFHDWPPRMIDRIGEAHRLTQLGPMWNASIGKAREWVNESHLAGQSAASSSESTRNAP